VAQNAPRATPFRATYQYVQSCSIAPITYAQQHTKCPRNLSRTPPVPIMSMSSHIPDTPIPMQTPGRHVPSGSPSQTECCNITYKNPFVLLGFLWGSSGPPMPLPFRLPTLLALPSPAAISPSAAIVPLRCNPPPLPLSILNPFHPSSSRSSLRTFSLSSRTSLSARFACSWLWLSELCSSSMVVRSVDTFSLALLTSSTS
jgi:hypothetical protein